MREVSPLLPLLFVLLANLPPSSTVSPLNFRLSPPSHAAQQLLRRRDVADQQEAAAPGLSSLTFVFDRTGSMNDDLNQVRQGAKGIFETVMKQRKKFIFNYVLVLFHDPEVDPPFITTDPDMFQQQLASVSVQGGGDCPEMTLSGIKKALEVSLPGSFIYVFTDARSKDYHLEEAVLNLIQEKQSSVVFVMTGDCGNRSAPGYKVFERIAAASFGQVFHLEKSHVNTVLEYVRHAVSQRKVHILYEVREHGQTHTTLVPVDAFVSELTLSLAGERDDGAYLSIALVDPQNRTIEKSDYEREQGTIDLTNVKLIRIKNPLPGVWRVRTSSRLKHTLRIFGHGTIDFKYGFASRPVASVDLTHPRPIAGQITYLVVNMTGLNPPGTVVQISLVDYHGKELYRNESQADPDSFSVFFVGPFIPPKGFFFVRVNGEDEMNYEFVRIAPTAISTVEVVGPRAFMAERHTAHAYKSINLSCSIESRAPYTVLWLFGGKAIGGPLFYDSTDTSIWTIDAVTSAHRGLYTCQVISPQGNHSAMTFLDSRESPPHIIAIRNESVIIHGTAFLHCRTQSIEEPKIFWVHNQSKTLGNSAKAYTFGNNGTLRLLDTAVDDSGDYTCRARTSGGQSEAIVWLHVLQAPRVRVRPSEKWVASGSTFNLSCATEGRPQPEVIWFFKGARIVPDPKFFITYKGDLIVSEVDEDDKGVYECRATNSVGKASDFAKVHLALPPSIEVSQNKQMIVRGDLLVLDCRAISGVPTPKIHWFKDGRQLTSDRFLHIQEGRLTIRNADESDAGTYACKAENLAGSEIKPITLGIGSAPTIMAGPDSVFGYIQRTVTILCRAIGVPKPQVRWLMNGEPIGEGGETERFVHLPDDSLLIKDVQTTDQATFTCVARNEFGEQLKHTNLVVIGLVRPVLAVLPARMELIEGKELQINCIVLLGIPHPKTHWLKNDRFLSSADDQRTVVLPDGSLLIKNGSEEDAGHYACHAESSAGNATVEVDVELIMKPMMALSARLGPSGDEDVVARKGAQLDIECPVKVPLGQEQPRVLWTLDFVPLNVNSPDFTLLPNHSLRIHKVSNDHAGRYTCTAINQAGEAAKSTFVRVHTPPTIALGQSSFNLIRGDTVTFPCDVEGEPKPIVKWFLNGEALVDELVEEDGSLALEAVEDRHRGTFTCVAENELGRDERIISLAVHSAPIIEGKGIVRELVANESDWLELRCPATAHPPPKRRWNWNGLRIDLRDGERGAAGAAPSGHSVHLEMPSNGSLVIRRVALAHAGAYECHVSNMAGEDRLHYSLKVQTPPRIISDSTEKVIFTSIGASRDLFCFAEGVPEPTLSWEKDHLPVLPNNFSFIDPKGTLRFRHILLDDAGEYICRVKNPAGEANRSVRIVVQVPPYAQDGQIKEYTFIEDELADLFCLVDGDPKPDIQWLWQDNPLDMNSSRYATFGDGNLRIVNVRASDDGFYTCRATNRAGKEDLVIRVVVISPPEMRDSESAEFLSSLVGNPVILQCPLLVSKPSPLPNIQWTFNGTELPSESLGIAVLLSEDRRRLRVPKATVKHSGEYKCVAENAAGEAEKRFIVDVMEPPRFKDTSNTRYSVIEGRTVMLSCQADGTPQPTIEWRKLQLFAFIYIL
uniref:Ig-like domain-containing protein n=1 Tax=Globodera rostochiensis TaxID=31243 RepID=A0A914H3L7_GLORO